MRRSVPNVLVLCSTLGLLSCKGEPGPPGPPGPAGPAGPPGSSGPAVTAIRPDGSEYLAVRRMALPLGQSGYEACADDDSRYKQCVFVTLADPKLKGEQGGTVVATCNTRIERQDCFSDRKLEYTWKNLLVAMKPKPGLKSTYETTACKIDPPTKIGEREVFHEVSVWCIDGSPPEQK